MRREQTLTGIVHPEMIGDRVVWCDSGTSLGQLADKIRFGDPAKGWEGDERMTLTYNPSLRCFELMRLDDSGYHVIARRNDDEPLDERLIDHLVARDTRRGFDPIAAIEKNNAAIDKAKEEAAVADLVQRAERVRFEARKAGIL